MSTAFIYTDEFHRFDYGTAHPLKTFRLKLTYELIKAYGLLSLPDSRLVEAVMADEDDLVTFHDREYIEILKSANDGVRVAGAGFYGLGSGDNPVFKGLFDWSRLVVGASLQAAEMVDCGEVEIAFNISGGLHHAMASRASGFCYLNDPVVAIMSLLKRGRRVVYIDIDAHHGDGVQEAFYSSNKVLTISLHETGKALFPGTGFEYETGQGEGRGYSVNIPLPRSADDEIFMYTFNEIVPPLVDKFKPDIVISQLGVDSFSKDPLAHLSYSDRGFCEVVKRIKEISRKWVALGGGGYDVVNVAKAWTLAWGIMNGVDVPDKIPADFLSRYPIEGFQSGALRDNNMARCDKANETNRKEAERVVEYLKREVL